MTRQKLANPKVQRGISLAPELNERIREEADKYGRTWNETAELVLRRAFCSDAHDSQKQPETRHIQHGEDRELELPA